MPQLKHSLAVCTFLLSASSGAQTTAKPANATGQCKDGTYSTATSESGACRGHNGIKDWYAAIVANSGTPPPPVPVAPPTQQPATQQPTTKTQQSKPTSPKGPKANLASTPAAPGGALNLVWLNSSSNVYHCYGTDFYGKTKAGAYMTEAEAKAKGAHGNRGATCSK